MTTDSTGLDARSADAPEAVFGPYAAYYDLLYRDKDYQVEAAFVHGLLQSGVPGARTVLDLGCGTGAHAQALARLGYAVHGVDRSIGMLELAQQRRASLADGPDADLMDRLSFSLGDVRSVRLDSRFDAVVALFHVASYQTTNEALRALFDTARQHLRPGGVFLFDAWYGPAVLSDPPVVRIKRMQDHRVAVTRLAEPVLHPNRNLVEVHYEVQIRDSATGRVDCVREVHEMRYLFQPEVELMSLQGGLVPVAAGPWMTGGPAGTFSWNVWFSARLPVDS
jgi:SAM-dependent methyltransferase